MLGTYTGLKLYNKNRDSTVCNLECRQYKSGKAKCVVSNKWDKEQQEVEEEVRGAEEAYLRIFSNYYTNLAQLTTLCQ